MQLWTEINVVTLQKLIETMPQQMHAIIGAKGGPNETLQCVTFFWMGSV